MGTRGRPRTRRMFNVVFDTNAIFNKAFDTLVCQAAKDLIAHHSNHGDLHVRWLIPEVVRAEREFQMRNEYREISSHLAKAERLFEAQWDITPQRVEQQIAARIAAELAERRIEVLPCTVEQVNWTELMRRSCFRELPFERGQTEKGFRDAIVCETFVQLAMGLVGRDTAVLVSKDRLVKQYIESCAFLGDRVRVVDDLAALHFEIELRVAHVDEATQNLIEQRAQQLFFPWENREDQTCLWVRERLYERIWAEHGERLKEAPTGVSSVTAGQELSNARLVSKQGTRVHFESTYFVQTSYRYWVTATNIPQDAPAVAFTSPALQGLPTFTNNIAQGGLFGALSSAPPGEWKQIDKPFKDAILTRWSATFSRNRTLTHARIDELGFVESRGAV